MKKFQLILAGLFLVSSLYGQTIDEVLKKIDLKLEKDKKYLNLYFIAYSPYEVKDTLLYYLPKPNEKKPFRIEIADGVTYRLVFLKEGIGIDSLVILYLEKIKQNVGGGAKFFAAGGKPQIDTTMEYEFSDLYYLSKHYPLKYYHLYHFLKKYIGLNGEDVVQSLLGIKPDKSVKTMLGISARDNLDFLNFARANYNHWYPYEKKQTTGAFRRGGGGNYPVRVDASFSSLTFSYAPWMDFSFGGGASIEFGTGNKLLNILPWEGMNFTAAARILLELNKEKGVNRAFFIDSKVGMQFKARTNSVIEKVPLIMTDAPRLNTVTAFFADIYTTRVFGLPFMNLYFNVGERNFENPYSIVDVNGNQKAYFTFSQLAYTMSFYWDGSDKRTTRFKMDIGAGYHDIWEASFNATGNMSGTKLIQEKFSPIVGLYFNLAPKGRGLFGIGIRSYDSRPKITGWFRIVEISARHSIRAEAIYFAPPVGRKLHPWENENGVMIQIRYRLGV
jgi:hypothetical protein